MVYILLSAKRRAYFCKSIAIEMGGVSRYFSKVSGSGVALTLLSQTCTFFTIPHLCKARRSAAVEFCPETARGSRHEKCLEISGENSLHSSCSGSDDVPSNSSLQKRSTPDNEAYIFWEVRKN